MRVAPEELEGPFSGALERGDVDELGCCSGEGGALVGRKVVFVSS